MAAVAPEETSMSRPTPIPSLISLTAFATLTITMGCDVSNPDPPDDEQEVITTVRLTFTPAGGGDAVVAAYADPENDGDPVIDDITLDSGVTYALTLTFENELEDPAEDITEEIEEEDEDHQVLLYGNAVSGPAADNAGAILTHSYDDEDDNGFPVGLANTIVANAAGTGELQVMLRHLPPESDTAVKDADIAADFASGGSAGIPGDVDVDVVFDVTVQ